MSEIVRSRVDLSKPPFITPAMRKQLKALAVRPDSEIDLSDIPELTEDFFKNAVQPLLQNH